MPEGKILKAVQGLKTDIKSVRRTLAEHGQMLADHDEQLEFLRENAVSKLEFEQFRREYWQGQDQVMTILKDIRQEMAFSQGWLRRHDEDIYRIKTRLQMA